MVGGFREAQMVARAREKKIRNMSKRVSRNELREASAKKRKLEVESTVYEESEPNYGWTTNVEGKYKVYLNLDCWKTVIRTGLQDNGTLEFMDGYAWNVGTILNLATTSKGFLCLFWQYFWEPILQSLRFAVHRLTPTKWTVGDNVNSFLVGGGHICTSCMSTLPCRNVQHQRSVYLMPVSVVVTTPSIWENFYDIESNMCMLGTFRPYHLKITPSESSGRRISPGKVPKPEDFGIEFPKKFGTSDNKPIVL